MLPALPMLRQHCRPTTPVCPDDHASAYAAEPDTPRNEMGDGSHRFGDDEWLAVVEEDPQHIGSRHPTNATIA
jgi:hypothetical protein